MQSFGQEGIFVRGLPEKAVRDASSRYGAGASTPELN